MCPNLTCRKVLAVPTSYRGKTIRCRNCSTNIRVPMNSKADDEINTDKKPDFKKSA
jgi:hypothetical protein